MGRRREGATVLLIASLLAGCGGGAEPGEFVRTPEERFRDLPGFPFEPHYMEIRGLRIHYLDEGPPDARPVLLLHGEPTWSYLYRKVIPPLTLAGLRAVAPDLVGFGRSDKYVRPEDYSFQMQVDVIDELVARLDLRGATLFGQDWGGLIGLRVVTDQPERFDGVVVGNTGLPAAEPGQTPALAFRLWRVFSRWSPFLPVGRIVDAGSTTALSAEERAAYDAPFPTRRYMAGARVMPSLVPITPDDPAIPANRRAWEVLRRWDKPLLTAFSDGDPITRGLERSFQAQVPGAQGQAHVTLRGAGHFLQEDAGEELGALLVRFVRGLDRETGSP